MGPILSEFSSFKMDTLHVNSSAKKFKTFRYEVFQDKKLSWRARGIMAYLLSKPEEWEGQLFDLTRASKEGRKIVQKALKELVDNGYAQLKHRPLKDNKFQGSYYEFFDTPKTVKAK
jgi:hypothetical protein